MAEEAAKKQVKLSYWVHTAIILILMFGFPAVTVN